jgi:hypothetical protein
VPTLCQQRPLDRGDGVRAQVSLVTCDRDHAQIAGDLPVDVVYLQLPV